MDGLENLRIAYFPEPHACKFSWAFYTLTDVVPFQNLPLQIERKTPAHPISPVQRPEASVLPGGIPASILTSFLTLQGSGECPRAGQMRSASRRRRGDFGECGPTLPFRPSQPRRRGCSISVVAGPRFEPAIQGNCQGTKSRV